MYIKSVLENPEITQIALEYIYSKWGNENTYNVYKDSIYHCATPFPNWYLLMDNDRTIGCAGLISNDFISRGDLYPWLCALYIEEDYRGNALSNLLIERIKRDAMKLGFNSLYLCTEITGFYENYGFKYIGDGYHPWGSSSRIYEISLT